MITASTVLLAATLVTPGACPQSATAYDFSKLRSEKLRRGVVAFRSGEREAVVTWRYRRQDPTNLAFNVYRDGTRLNSTPLTGATFLKDGGFDAAKGATYSVRPVLRGRESRNPARGWTVPANAPIGYIPLKVEPPPAWRNPDEPDSAPFPYKANDCSIGDLDGDGEFELIIKWDACGRDNSHFGRTAPVFYDGYDICGYRRLWRLSPGKNVRSGPHYDNFIVFDFDGDGISEIAMRTSDGAVDGLGRILGDPQADHVDKDGQIRTAPEFLTIFSGRDGRLLASVPYDPPYIDGTHWSHNKRDNHNRGFRFLACVAYLDGVHPSLVMCRGLAQCATGSPVSWRTTDWTVEGVFSIWYNVRMRTRGFISFLLILAAALPRLCDAQKAVPVPDAFQNVPKIVAFAGHADAAGVPVKMLVEVVHVSALRENTCVVASTEKPWGEGVVVKVPDSRLFAPGDVLLVEGTTIADGRTLGVQADRVQRLRKEELPPPINAKFADLRLGKLRTRRIALKGEITDIFVDNAPNGRVQTHFRIAFEHSRATCRVPGKLPSRYAHVGEVRVTGCVFDDLNAEGALVDSVVELEGQSAIEVLSSVYWWRVGVVFLSAVAAVLLVILLVALFRMRRRRIADRAVAVERQRMAADLHDTIEQHLAGVKILLTCAMKPEGVPPETKKVLEQAAAMLIHAKSEVRSTIMNLRSAGDDKSLADHFQEIAASLRRSGLSVKVLLRGVPERMDAAIIYFRNSPSVLFWEAGNNQISPVHMREMRLLKERLDPHGHRFMGCRTLSTPEQIAEAEYVGTMIHRHDAKASDAMAKTGRWLPVVETEYCREESPRRAWDRYSPPDYNFVCERLSSGAKQWMYNCYDMTQEDFALSNGGTSDGYGYFYGNRAGGDGKLGKYYAACAMLCWTDCNQHGRNSSTENCRSSGRVDAVRIPKENFYVHQVMYAQTPKVKILGHWNYPKKTAENYWYSEKVDDGKVIAYTGKRKQRDPEHKTVYVIGSLSVDSVRLFVNGRQVGEAKLVRFSATSPASS